MKVLLISPNKETINMVTLPLGMGCVAAATRRAGHEVKVVDLLAGGEGPLSIGHVLKGFGPDVIGISVRNIDDQSMNDTRFLLEEVRGVVDECRAFSGAPVVLGGAGYSIFPESTLAALHADMGIQGEGESAFPALLDRMANGSDLKGTPGLYVAGHGLQGDREFERDLDRLPLPEPSLWIPAGLRHAETWIPVQTRRGCPLRCSYCSTPTIEGRRLRKRSPEKVVAWVAAHVQAGFRRFQFVDNTFNLPADYAREICRTMLNEGVGISWRSILYPAGANRALIQDMARAGCQEVALGFESGCDRMLRSMKEGFTTEDVREVSGNLADSGIRQMGFLLLGGPGETRDSVEESLAFADALPLNMVKVSVGIRIYPETTLAGIAAAQGMIRPDQDLLFPTFYLERALDGWLQDTVKRWMEERPHWVT